MSEHHFLRTPKANDRCYYCHKLIEQIISNNEPCLESREVEAALDLRDEDES